MDFQYLKYYHEIEERLIAAAVDPYEIKKLRDNRVSHFLHFSKYTVVKIEYKRVGRIGKGGKRIRHGNSGTRDATLDLDRIPADKKRFKGPPMSQAIIIRYFDKSKTRQDWRSFYRRNFIASFAWLDDSTGKFTTDPSKLVTSGQVPPPPFTLSRGTKRRVNRIIETLKRKIA